ncbi:general secretion pathway protein C [Oxalobacteraceae bacterium GrIS 1.11]
MKRMPLLVSFIAVVALSASLAFWALQLFKPPQRPLAAAPAQVLPEPNVELAAGLFGGQLQTAVVSNYQLKGVVAAGNGRGSAAILATDSKPAQAYAVGAEVVSGVNVKEIAPRFVLLSENGALKRVELAVESAKSGADAPPSSSPPPPPPPSGLQMPPPSRINVVPAPASVPAPHSQAQ